MKELLIVRSLFHGDGYELRYSGGYPKNEVVRVLQIRWLAIPSANQTWLAGKSGNWERIFPSKPLCIGDFLLPRLISEGYPVLASRFVSRYGTQLFTPFSDRPHLGVSPQRKIQRWKTSWFGAFHNYLCYPFLCQPWYFMVQACCMYIFTCVYMYIYIYIYMYIYIRMYKPC